MLNPYIAGSPVVEASMFFGREDVFGWIERSLEGKYVNHILVLHGQRRVGKTSVLKQIPNFLPDKYIQVFFDLQGRTGTTLDRFLWWLASEITRTLKREHGIEFPRPDRKDFEEPEYLINGFLPDIRTKLGDYVLLLTFDEFDSLDRPEIQETLSQPLIAYLRRLIEVEGLNFIFSIGSSGDKLENMQASYTDFFKSALYRKISFLTKDDIQRLVTKPVAGLIHYEKEAVRRIGEITSGHPYFTQLMCHELFSRCQKTGDRTISAEDVEAVLEDVVERGTVNLKFIWDEASDLEKWIMATLAKMDGGSNQELARALTKQHVRFSEQDLNSATLHLRDKDILRDDNHFVIHLMRLWLVANRSIDRVREELEEVNPIANRFIEIGDEYRDRGEAQQAIAYYQQALNMNPGNFKAQNNIANVHLEQKNYEQAVQAFESALKIDDEDVVAKTGFSEASLALGEQARGRKEYEDAIHYYQQVLEINPNHVEAKERSTKFQKLVNDYEEAQQAIREKRYERAVELLQGIIVVDPTYKSTTRLLTEAVDARKTIPFWRRPWLLPAVGILVLVVLSVFFGPQVWATVSTAIANRPAATEPVISETPDLLAVGFSSAPTTATPTSTPTSEPSAAFYEPIQAYIESEPPTFVDDFETTNNLWGTTSEDIAISTLIDNGELNIFDNVELSEDNSSTNDFNGLGVTFPTNGLLSAKDFAIKFDFHMPHTGSEEYFGVVFRSKPFTHSSVDNSGYTIKFFSTGSWELIQNEDETLIATGSFGQKVGQFSGRVLLIVREQNLAVYMNEILLYDDSVLSVPETSINNGFSVEGTAVKFRFVEFWNLDGLEFSTTKITGAPTIIQTLTPRPTPTITPTPAWVPDFVEPMLERITDVTPDFSEDFSNPQKGWEWIVGTDGSFQIKNGMARADVKKDEYSHFRHPTVDSLTARDFIMEMDARVVEGKATEDLWIHFIFNENPSDAQNLGFQVQPAESIWSVAIDSAQGRNSLEGKGNINPVGQFTNITIILADQNVAFLLNGSPIAYLEDPYLDEPAPSFHFICNGSSGGGTCEFDNIKIWKLP
jgi:tetratricopeptide (TPR) repeat protein